MGTVMKNTPEFPGFKMTAEEIARREGIPLERAQALLIAGKYCVGPVTKRTSPGQPFSKK